MAVFKTDCPHCATSSVGFTVAWGYKFASGENISTCICGACRKPIMIHFHGIEGGVENFDGDISNAWYVAEIWPRTQELEAPAHTPIAVANRYIEGEDAYRRRRWNSAVAMYRSALDIATKAMPDVPGNLSFFNRLIWLHDNHRITSQMKDWGDHVRVEGNEALHDPEEFAEEDAKPLRLFTETFLRYVYELPGEVAAFRGEAPGANG